MYRRHGDGVRTICGRYADDSRAVSGHGGCKQEGEIDRPVVAQRATGSMWLVGVRGAQRIGGVRASAGVSCPGGSRRSGGFALGRARGICRCGGGPRGARRADVGRGGIGRGGVGRGGVGRGGTRGAKSIGIRNKPVRAARLRGSICECGGARSPDRRAADSAHGRIRGVVAPPAGLVRQEQRDPPRSVVSLHRGARRGLCGARVRSQLHPHWGRALGDRVLGRSRSLGRQRPSSLRSADRGVPGSRDPAPALLPAAARRNAGDHRRGDRRSSAGATASDPSRLPGHPRDPVALPPAAHRSSA